MWQALNNWIYDLIVWSGIINYFTPVLLWVIEHINISVPETWNHQAVDEKGNSFRMTRYNGKSYPAIGVDKILAIPYFKVRKDDVLLCSYPKAGCHWLSEILHMLVTGKSKLTSWGKEFSGGFDLTPYIILDSQPSPRVLNSHLLYKDLPHGIRENKIKIVSLVRNPKDTVVSYFNHHKSLKKYNGYDGDFNSYFKLFMEGELEYGSLFDYILEWDSAYKHQSDNQILLVTYEDLKARPLETVETIANFLEIGATRQFVMEVLEASNFDKMKTTRQKQANVIGHIYRKGIVGDWRSWLTEEQSEAIDKVWRERMMGCAYQPQY